MNKWGQTQAGKGELRAWHTHGLIFHEDGPLSQCGWIFFLVILPRKETIPSSVSGWGERWLLAMASSVIKSVVMGRGSNKPQSSPVVGGLASMQMACFCEILPGQPQLCPMQMSLRDKCRATFAVDVVTSPVPRVRGAERNMVRGQWESGQRWAEEMPFPLTHR